MPNKKAFILTNQGKYNEPRTNRFHETPLEKHYLPTYLRTNGTSSNNHKRLESLDDIPSSSKTRFTRQIRGSTNTDLRKSLFPTPGKQITDGNLPYTIPSRRSIRDIEQDFRSADTSITRPTSRKQSADTLTDTISKLRRKSDIELGQLRMDTVTTPRAQLSLDRMKRAQYINSQYDDGDEEKSRKTSPPFSRMWYNDNKSAQNRANSNLDLVSLHPLINEKSNNQSRRSNSFLIKLAYSLAGILLWTMIVLCIEEVDVHFEESICKPEQEVRYWASCIALVVIVTATTVYTQKGDPTDAAMTFVLNTMAFASIHHVPLSCIRRSGLDKRSIGRIRGGIVLFLLFALLLVVVLKKYLISKKT